MDDDADPGAPSPDGQHTELEPEKPTNASPGSREATRPDLQPQGRGTRVFVNLIWPRRRAIRFGLALLACAFGWHLLQ